MTNISVLQQTITKQHKNRFKLSNFLRVSISVMILSAILVPPSAHSAITTNEVYEIEQIEITTDEIIPTQKPNVYQPQTLDNPPSDIRTNIPKYSVTSSSDAFSITHSQTAIDFGTLSATNPVIRTSEFTLLSPLQGAQIIANQDRPMTATNRQFVPDTTCDNGVCTAGLASIWESSLTYGFGYRCESEDKGVCDNAFTHPNTYKQFADASANESFQTILASKQSKQLTRGKITYKINISGTQPLGGYRNTITFIAIPNF